MMLSEGMRGERVVNCTDCCLTPDVVVRWHISNAAAAVRSISLVTAASTQSTPVALVALSSRAGCSMTKQVAAIAAACRSNGIGSKGSLPWRGLKKEMAFFTRITSETEERGKKNAVVMGRKTWESIPAKYRPLADRVNVILSRNLTEVPVGADFLFSSLHPCLLALQSNQQIERIFLIGGQQVYADAISSQSCQRIYLTRIDADFECDIFFPDLDPLVYCETVVHGDEVPSGIQEENGIKYQFHVYERVTAAN